LSISTGSGEVRKKGPKKVLRGERRVTSTKVKRACDC